ncbi:MAG: flagellar motor protein [Thermodesulfovibrionales bacterium]|nr:flagellar motor protein [Thermodesulfovibrionales bacterium]
MIDRGSIFGLILGITAIVAANYIEGGSTDSLFQLTAAMIVFGGTLGATMLSFPFKDIKEAINSLKDVFWVSSTDYEQIINDIINYAYIVRKNGMLALEDELTRIDDPFLKKSIRLAIDGMNPKLLRQTMEQENLVYEENKKRIAKVFETAGGFAPTIGIIGAVMGLIQVMQNLSDPSKLGAGIAVAFVATIYGVGSANLILLPISKRLLNKLHSDIIIREMMLEGVISIQLGLNPYYIDEKLRAFLQDSKYKYEEKI